VPLDIDADVAFVVYVDRAVVLAGLPVPEPELAVGIA
jgi:hypothetical protein